MIFHKSVLITGGTGSFGNAFVRRLLAEEELVERIVIFSRDEFKQAEMAQALLHEFPDDFGRLRFFIGDVRDRDRLRRAFEGVGLVIHAAALKRIEVGHYNPGEMVKTNVTGAINVIEAAQDAGVNRVVALSSDKAWQPISPYGQTKALAESLFLNANHTVPAGGPHFAVTRYGNVWRSKGSVVPKWEALLRSGERFVPVTDPDATRFFMTMNEAIDLVLSAATDFTYGDIIVPRLPAFRLGDLAEAMGAEMEVTGLPPWEKMHEGMAMGNTSDIAPRMTVDDLKGAL